MTEESDEVREAFERHSGDNDPVSAGWSITVGQLRKAIADIPDDYEVMLENADVEDCEISNLNINYLYPPALGLPGLLIVGGGQIVSSEYAYHARMDAHHVVGGVKSWNHYAHPEEWHDDRN